MEVVFRASTQPAGFQGVRVGGDLLFQRIDFFVLRQIRVLDVRSSCIELFDFLALRFCRRLHRRHALLVFANARIRRSIRCVRFHPNRIDARLFEPEPLRQVTDDTNCNRADNRWKPRFHAAIHTTFGVGLRGDAEASTQHRVVVRRGKLGFVPKRSLRAHVVKQQRLCFFPLPHGQGSFLPTLMRFALITSPLTGASIVIPIE
jgi:hypothetical protein